MLKRLSKILRIIIVLLLIVVAFLSVTMKYDNCGKCEFEINGTEYSASSFMSLYHSKCLNYRVSYYGQQNFSEINFSGLIGKPSLD